MTSLTTAERALDLFRQRPDVENRIDWIANQLLALAAEGDGLALRIVATEAGGHALECAESGHVSVTTEAGPVRLFRTVLARLAKMAEEESGAAFNPYGGALVFRRCDIGAVSVEFSNVAALHSVRFAKRI
ncbi:hypothetical protein [Gemmata sp.]|uniref:hypothetical protein n=1 Tax=Gemmata sp. TaxID=1914242 RepID=UPI003F70A6DA